MHDCRREAKSQHPVYLLRLIVLPMKLRNQQHLWQSQQMLLLISAVCECGFQALIKPEANAAMDSITVCLWIDRLACEKLRFRVCALVPLRLCWAWVEGRRCHRFTPLSAAAAAAAADHVTTYDANAAFEDPAGSLPQVTSNYSGATSTCRPDG